jgi:CheY-like chemotaxis protein
VGFLPCLRQRILLLLCNNSIETIGAGFIRPLQEEGFDVFVATTATQALKVLESDQPLDLVVVDLIMPPGEGFEDKVKDYDYGRTMGLAVFEKIHELRGNIPAICFTVVPDPEVAHRVKNLGAVALLSKPTLPSEFLEQVKLALVRASAPPKTELVHEELERRKLELESSHASTRLRAVWALGEIGHYDATLLSRLNRIGREDRDAEVRAAARRAAKRIRRKLRQESQHSN